MYRIIYMKADYEPWWQFEGWEETIIEEKTFESKEEAKTFLKEILNRFEQKYPHHDHRKERFWAFWTDDEIQFCEACADDIQTFHGIIWQEIN